MRLTFLFDPLCGWCYGAAPALAWIAQSGAVALDLAPTGLFAGEGGQPMDPAFADYVWQNDQRIADQTGQPFSDAYRALIFRTPGAAFDSASATLGLVAIGLTRPGREFEGLQALQKARYVAGRDTADRTVVADVLAGAGFAEAAGRLEEPDPELRKATRHRIEAAVRMAARFGARGVPALVLADEEGARRLPSGILFGDRDRLAAELRAGSGETL
ncbi:protein-disulfide isomerase [Methylobacterium sp. Leaf465]|uniref:DsbA family protein n=1 Tax=Methylobacterium sp. Leaf465 TaxID=1736385 RepID=UPI0006F4A648|nr:DsbA family protein [Methylobacterium sp. Leaf465]KQT79923.1 protein-disulfide isomerase [Methylobacterium sp. Leaf465]